MPIQTISKRRLFHTQRDMTREQQRRALEDHAEIMKHEIMAERLTREDVIWSTTKKMLEVYGAVTITEDEHGIINFSCPVEE